jgi:hypothetical protein
MYHRRRRPPWQEPQTEEIKKMATIDDTTSDNDAMHRKIFIGANPLNKGKRWKEVKARKFHLCRLQWFAIFIFT